VISLLSGGTAAAQPAVDTVIARVIAAQGGLGRLHTIRCRRMTGHIWYDSATSATVIIEQRRPNMMYEEITNRASTVIRAFDGAAGWTKVLSNSDTILSVLSGDDLKNIAEESDFDGPLVDARLKGNTIEMVGTDSVHGSPAFKLRVTLRDGRVDYWYIDRSTWLPAKWEGSRTIDSSEVQFETYFRDYLTVDGLRFVRVMESGAPGALARQQMTFDHVELNPALEPRRFVMPDSTSTGVAN